MLSASDLGFGRGARGSSRTWTAPSGWDDPVVRGVAALGVASVLVPVLVVGILAVSLLAMPFSGSMPAERPSIESRITRIYDGTGAEIANFRRFETSLPIARADIPPVLVDAVLATEDQRFYDHKGVDSRGIFRAFWADVKGGGYVEGGSTITQQYVRLVYTGDERTVGRKLKEAVLAGRVEKKLSKDEILYRYLSRAYFGSGAYGVGAAAETYFNKSIRDLSLTEAAMLAGLLSAPSHYDPRANPSEAEYQRQRVLGKMVDQGRITQQQYNEALPLRVTMADNLPRTAAAPAAATVVQPAKALPMKYPWFSDYVRGYLRARYGDDKVYAGGLRVETALDPAMQAKAEAAVAEALKGTQAPLDMALAAVEPKTGLVRAMVGGRDFSKSQVNLALGNCPERPSNGEPGSVSGDAPICVAGGGSGRQPGSAFKPFTLAEALEDRIPLDKAYRGSGTYTYPNCRGEGCTVRNVESGGYGFLNLRQATAYSVNTVYAQLVQDAGVEDTAEMAYRLGLTAINPEGELPNGEPYGPSLTLGAAEVSPLDMAAAYGVFAARGMQYPASPVLRVLGPDGKVLEDNTRRQGKRVLGENIADNMNDVLKGVIAGGTGKAADIGRPNGTAGKTGTSENHSDAWFVGYTPELSTSIWMGYSDSQKPLLNIKDVPRVYGGTIPAKTWHAFMTAALEGKPTSDFAPPGALLPQPAPSVPRTPSPSTVPRPAPTVTVPPVVEPVPTEPAPVPPYFYPVPQYPTYPSDPVVVPPSAYTPPATYTPPPTYVPPGAGFQPPPYVPAAQVTPGVR